MYLDLVALGGEQRFTGGAWIEGRQIPFPFACLRVTASELALEPRFPQILLWRFAARRVPRKTLFIVERKAFGWLDVLASNDQDFTFMPLGSDGVVDALGTWGIPVKRQ
jgi:hypothetical protein